MHEILLNGLPAKHPAAALATIGLLATIPEAKIYHKAMKGNHYPVLVSSIKNVENLASFLVKEETWHKMSLPPKRFNKTQLVVKDFEEEFLIDPDHAAGNGTDLEISYKEMTIDKKGKIKKEVACGSKTPFNLLIRNSLHSNKCAELLEILKEKDAIKTLSQYPWDKIKGEHYSLFPEEEASNVYKNKTDNKANVIKTVPIVALLAIASWRLFPVFLSGRDVITLGWDGIKSKKETFSYPVFNRPVNAKEFMSFIGHPDLKNFTKNESAWLKIGVSAVYCNELFYYTKGGGNFQSSKTL